VAQESYLRAFDAQQSGEELRSPKAFLFRIAKNIALNELGRKSRQLTDYIEDSAQPDVLGADSSAEERVIAQERLTLYCQAVATLPPQCRRAFLLRKVYGLSHKDIGEQLGISVSTVEKHIASGLLRCSLYLKERGHAVEPLSAPPGKRDRRLG
jgi:RNA polymerase sigma-70 factor (ECF subfamily)